LKDWARAIAKRSGIADLNAQLELWSKLAQLTNYHYAPPGTEKELGMENKACTIHPSQQTSSAFVLSMNVPSTRQRFAWVMAIFPLA
jgi:hypothetical protein